MGVKNMNSKEKECNGADCYEQPKVFIKQTASLASGEWFAISAISSDHLRALNKQKT